MRFIIILVLLLLSYTNECIADISRYTDDEGIIHYTSAPTDSRYKLFMINKEDLLLISVPDSGESNKSKIKYPPKYSGDNLLRVVDKMKKLSKKAKTKSEFETTKEYQSRLQKIIELNKNEKDISFVFKPRSSELKYDADKKVLSISIKNYDYNDNYESFVLKDTRKITGSYVSSNGFGVKIKVTKIDQDLIQLKHNTSEIYNASDIDLSMDTIKVLVSPEIAKKIMSTIAVSYTASPIPHYYVFETQKSWPTFNDPREVILKKHTLYVEFKKISVFNKLTGEIYGSLDIEERLKAASHSSN